MAVVQQVLFGLVLIAAFLMIRKRVLKIKSNINLGRDFEISGDSTERWKTMFLVAFGQQKMFKKLIPAFFHFLIYAGFLIINIEVLEFILDGVLGTHRVFAPALGSFYTVLMNIFELLAVLVMVSCVIFLIRRNVFRVARFQSAEMTSWPKLDANLILIIEIILMLAILTMNAADQLLQGTVESYTFTGKLFFSSMLIPLFQGITDSTLIIIERSAWWFHIIGILAFALYVTYSKHLHIFMAFPNTFFSNLTAKGKISNMDEVTNEVKMMLGVPVESPEPPAEVGRFGAKDVNDLTWKNLMDAYSCTECGRCTSECPANLTGKKLSPRKIMMDTRDRVEDLGKAQKGNEITDDGKSLLGDYISKEEINACTSCNACTEACPVNIDPLSIILQLRRYVSLEESGAPASWNAMFSNIETNFSPWKFAPTDRFNWAKELKETDQ